MIIRTHNQSMFCQALTMVALIRELHCKDFLNSDFYHKQCFNRDANSNNYKKILENSGLGNPATLQMELYVLLVMPKELLGRGSEGNDKEQSCIIKDKFNALFLNHQLSSVTIKSTYLKEQDINKTNFYRHIRNAVAHSRCSYEQREGINYITFEDEDKKKDIEENIIIKMSTADAETIVDKLQIWIMEYLNTSSEN